MNILKAFALILDIKTPIIDMMLNFYKDISLEEISQMLNLSSYYFSKLFKEEKIDRNDMYDKLMKEFFNSEEKE